MPKPDLSALSDYTRYENYVKEILIGIKKLILILPLVNKILPLVNKRAAARMVHDMWYELETEIQQESRQKFKVKL